MNYFCTVLHEVDLEENEGYFGDPHFLREVADTVRSNHAATNGGSGYVEVKPFPKGKEERGRRLKQLLYLLLIVFKVKLVLHRPSDNYSTVKKKKPWSHYNHDVTYISYCQNVGIQNQTVKMRKCMATSDPVDGPDETTLFEYGLWSKFLLYRVW